MFSNDMKKEIKTPNTECQKLFYDETEMQKTIKKKQAKGKTFMLSKADIIKTNTDQQNPSFNSKKTLQVTKIKGKKVQKLSQ